VTGVQTCALPIYESGSDNVTVGQTANAGERDNQIL
jgi:hypothetical protein